MEYLTIVVLAISIAIAIFQFLNGVARRSQKLPPGPTPWPLIGNLHLLGGQPHKSLAELAKNYGPLMCLRLGQVSTVVISSPDMAKEVLQKQDLAFSSCRSIPDALRSIDHYKYSVAFLPVGHKWRSLRKVMNSYLFTNSRLDANRHLRLAKVDELIENCRRSSRSGKPVDIGSFAFTTSLNLLSNTLFSDDVTGWFGESSEEFKNLIREIMVEIGKPNLVDFFPVLTRLDPQGVRRRMDVPTTKLLKLVDGFVDDRLKLREEEGIVKNDMLDFLITSSEQKPEEFDRSDIVHMILDLFTAGTDTTSSTVEWAMAETMKNSEIMQKIKKELATTVGKGKPIEEDDVSQLPYLRCIVKETLRLHPPAPLLLPRKAAQDGVQACGYNIPKGSQVFVNAWAIGRDSSVWESPLDFKPERFWQSEKDVRGQHFELIPFGAGRRICPGLPLGMKMVHLMLGSLLNSFDWKLDGGVAPENLDMEELFGLTLQKAQPLRAVPQSY